MSGPFIPARAGQPLDLLEQSIAGGGWEALEALFSQPAPQAPLAPGDDVARFMWGLYCTPQGRAMFEWMMDISIRQPLRATGRGFEETALATATKQGVNGFAEVILKAIGHGHDLVQKPRSGDAT